MADKITIKLEGLKETVNALQKFLDDAQEEVEAELLGTANEVARDAKRRAPVDNGQLRQGIKAVKVGKLNVQTIAEEPYSAYVEFGTGKKVHVPAEMKDVAAKARGSRGNKGVKMWDAIQAWAKRKGLDKNAAYLIYASIKRNGIRPQPFMYPAFKAKTKGLDKRIDRILTDIGRRV